MNSAPHITTAIVLTRSAGIVSDEATQISSWVFYLLSEIVAIFGAGANIINIICFARLGLKDPINVSFLGLAISDLGNLVFLLWTCICLIPGFQEFRVPFDSVEFQYLTTGWPHVVCTRVTSWITALVTVERCLCIMMPLKVKSLFTPRRITITIIWIFILNICGVIPIYIVSGFAWTFSSEGNRTILSVVYTDHRATGEQISHATLNVLSPFMSYIIVVIFTIVLVVQLRRKAKWRQKCTDSLKADSMLGRDQKVAKMVVMISALFIACGSPVCFVYIAMMVEPTVAMDGENKNIIFVFGGLCVFLEASNAAMNIFIYYYMSSKYKATFKQLFVRKRV